MQQCVRPDRFSAWRHTWAAASSESWPMSRSINEFDTQALSTIMACRVTSMSESIALEGVRRGVAALTDLQTVAALKQSLAS
jgi:hypothetical protein